MWMAVRNEDLEVLAGMAVQCTPLHYDASMWKLHGRELNKVLTSWRNLNDKMICDF